MVMRIRCLRSSIFHIFFNVSIAFLIESEFYNLSSQTFDSQPLQTLKSMSLHIYLSSQSSVT